MLPRLLALLTLSALLGLGGVLALASARIPSATEGGSTGGPHADMSPRERANKLAAARDAQALLAKLALPAGARRTRKAPPGAARQLAGQGLTIASPDVIDRHTFWIVPAPTPEVLAFVEAHPPVTSGMSSSGSGTERGATTASFLRFEWPPIPSVLYSRALSVVLVGLPGGSTAIRADAADMWDIPRPGFERIPTGASVLDVSVGRPHTRPSVALTVTDPTKVKKLAKAIDALQTAQPIAIACPNVPVDAPAVTFTFRATLRGPALAQASESASASGPIAPCETMSFSRAGRALTPLLGGATVVEQAQALLGVTLRRAR